MQYESELYHHGILGQKWGVRRYQNYDGTYTQAGLKRYNKSKSDYEQTKSAYKQGVGSKSDVKVAKKKMNNDYDRLKTDKKADEGKELYKKGETITKNTKVSAIREAAIIVGANVVGSFLIDRGKVEFGARMGELAVIGGSAVNAILAGKTNSKNNKLRAYYAH